ncbi:MAG: 30S ribosomal protein S4 [Chitinophagales bacterium]|nr:30S ribosomal protein S4 [Bacteroidota bacterium]MCB9042869.1 30S ribosomal protein S4 [Chitinophagales bacterium]
MARYTGPTTKIARKFGEAIFGHDKSFERRKYPPGQHGLSRKRKAGSEFAQQLKEKQKAKHTYGLLERQFRNLFEAANRHEGVTGTNLLQALESRLDNLVYRAGFAPSRRAARQLVVHKHIKVNGEVCNVPSRIMRPGEQISVRERSKNLDVVNSAIGQRGKGFPWIEWNGETMTATYLHKPERENIPENINEQLIVELYSK